MPKVIVIHGSPRRGGNTSTLLNYAAKGASDAGAHVDEIVLRDLKMSPCLELYGCKETGRCVIADDFQTVCDKMLSAEGLIIGTPVFFYAVSAHTKILMDRCQSLWVKKYWIDKVCFGHRQAKRKGLLISVGATTGKKLFDGVLLSMQYFFDVLDTQLWKSLLYRGLDFQGDVLSHAEYLSEAYEAGKQLSEALNGIT